MTYSKTAFDKINNDIANPLRQLQDIHLDISGTQTTLFRITQSDIDLYGDETFELSSSVMANCVIEYPFSDIELLTYKDQVSSLQTDVINMWDILPVKIIVKIDESLPTATQSVNFDENDYIMDVMKDQHDNKIPILMNAPVLKGTFQGKHLIQKTYEATLVRGILEDDIQTVVDSYLENLGVPAISSSVPASSESGVAVDTTIALTFNIAMNSGIAESYITFTPTTANTITWDSTLTVATITPANNLGSGIVYTAGVGVGAESGLGVPSEELQTVSFTTI